MKKQKIFAALLALTMGASVVGCDTTETTTSTEATKTTVGEVTQETTPEETKKEFQEKVYVDDENCTFKITGVEEDSIWGYTLKAYIENKTDKTLMFSWDGVSVNGFMCDPFWASEVQPGKKAIQDISFSEDSFSELGIENVESIDFTLSVTDSDDWEVPPYVNEAFTFNPNE